MTDEELIDALRPLVQKTSYARVVEALRGVVLEDAEQCKQADALPLALTREWWADVLAALAVDLVGTGL